jgi:hypothetical protein
VQLVQLAKAAPRSDGLDYGSISLGLVRVRPVRRADKGIGLLLSVGMRGLGRCRTSRATTPGTQVDFSRNVKPQGTQRARRFALE